MTVLLRRPGLFSHSPSASPAFHLSLPIRLGGLVTGGLVNIVTNFSKVAGQLSGPVAIVAAGSEIARTDTAGLFQVRVSQPPPPSTLALTNPKRMPCNDFGCRSARGGARVQVALYAALSADA